MTHTHSPEFIPPRPSLRSWLGGSCCRGEVRWRCSPDVTDVTSARQVSADLSYTSYSELFQVQTRSDPGPTLRSGPLRPGPRTRKYGSGPPSHRTEPRTHRFGSVRTSVRRGPDQTVDSVLACSKSLPSPLCTKDLWCWDMTWRSLRRASLRLPNTIVCCL